MPNEEKTTLRDFLIQNGFPAKGKVYESGSEELEITSEQIIDRGKLFEFIKKYLTENNLVFRYSAVFEEGGLDIMDGKLIIAFIHITLSERANYCRVSYRYLNRG